MIASSTFPPITCMRTSSTPTPSMRVSNWCENSGVRPNRQSSEESSAWIELRMGSLARSEPSTSSTVTSDGTCITSLYWAIRASQRLSCVALGYRSFRLRTRAPTLEMPFASSFRLSGVRYFCRACMSALTSKVPWCKDMPLSGLCLNALPEIFFPSTVMSLRPLRSASMPHRLRAPNTTSKFWSMLNCSLGARKVKIVLPGSM
mmetsp:Transcript_19948/g.46406  ORF Transcript_19948/g.46406 Transcript_19948/m.46406 type:complete len:204 (-) Transcript_19948:409-1020(-)